MENTLQLGNLLKEGTYPEEYTGGKNWTILHGDTLKLVKAFQPGIFDAVITDPPYASGGTKQNERNRTTNQKYSSMKQRMHCRILMGITRISVPGPIGWQSGSTMRGKPVKLVRQSACLLTGDNIPLLPMHSSGQAGSGEELRFGIRETLVRRKDVFASRLSILCGAVMARCQSTARFLSSRCVPLWKSPEPYSCDRETVAADERCHSDL